MNASLVDAGLHTHKVLYVQRKLVLNQVLASHFGRLLQTHDMQN